MAEARIAERNNRCTRRNEWIGIGRKWMWLTPSTRKYGRASYVRLWIDISHWLYWESGASFFNGCLKYKRELLWTLKMNTTLLLIVRVMQLRQLVVSIFSAKVMSQQFLVRFIVFFFFILWVMVDLVVTLNPCNLFSDTIVHELYCHYKPAKKAVTCKRQRPVT